MADETKDASHAGSDDQKDTKPAFTDEQQAIFNQAIEKAYNRAFAKADELAAKKVQTLEAQLTELKAKVEAAPEKTVKPGKTEAGKTEAAKPAESGAGKGPAIDVDAILARLDEVQQTANSLKAAKDEADRKLEEQRRKNEQIRIKERFISSASKIEFFDPMDVFDLVEGELVLGEDDDVAILNPKTKQPRISGSDPDKNMSLDEFLTSFAKAKPHMVRSRNADGGSGAGASRRQENNAGSALPNFAQMTPAQVREYADRVMSKAYTDRA